jgi:alpha-tubulin suppressor-like RCC1 family protein
MAISKSTLITKLQSAINDYAYASTSAEDVLSQSLSVWLSGEVNIVTVNTADDLPILEVYDSTDAILCFLLNLGIFAISSNKKWLTLDGRLLRDDTGKLYSESWAWGCNSINAGQLGDDTTISRSSPVSVVGGFTDWCQVSAGPSHSLGVRCNGTAWAWGCNTLGRLGNNSTINRSSPVSVVGGFTDWCQISAGYSHSLGLRTNGTAWAWGSNANGRLGDNDGTVSNRSSPVSVAGEFTDWRQVSTGYHSLGLRTNSTVWSWGPNNFGQLGDGTTISRSSPVSVVGGFTDWCQVSAGFNHSLGLRTNGTAWAWGYNGQGRLGDDSTISRSSPVSIVGGFTDWCQLSTNERHSLGVRCNGTAWAWGYNSFGRLGNNSTINRSSPVSVVGGFTDWCQLSAGGCHSLGLRSNGTAWAWGVNNQGRLGDNIGDVLSRSSPVSVAGGFTDWCQVSASSRHSLGITGK